METPIKTTQASIAIVRMKGVATCKACGYTVGNTKPHGELALQITGNGKPYRLYHFRCYEEALEDYQASLTY